MPRVGDPQDTRGRLEAWRVIGEALHTRVNNAQRKKKFDLLEKVQLAEIEKKKGDLAINQINAQTNRLKAYVDAGIDVEQMDSNNALENLPFLGKVKPSGRPTALRIAETVTEREKAKETRQINVETVKQTGRKELEGTKQKGKVQLAEVNWGGKFAIEGVMPTEIPSGKIASEMLVSEDQPYSGVQVVNIAKDSELLFGFSGLQIFEDDLKFSFGKDFEEIVMNMPDGTKITPLEALALLNQDLHTTEDAKERRKKIDGFLIALPQMQPVVDRGLARMKGK